MSELLDKQLRFGEMSVKFLAHLLELGYKFKYANALRTDEQAEINAIGKIGRDRIAHLIAIEFPLLADKIKNNGNSKGIRNSTHQLALALDIDLFKDGKYLAETEDHRVLGEYWESLGGTWGGRFSDGNHYSLEHEGVK